jgi:malate synthase
MTNFDCHFALLAIMLHHSMSGEAGSMAQRLMKSGLLVDPVLVDFIETQALPDTGVSSVRFWSGFSDIIHDLGPENRDLLVTRADLQTQIDDWHIARRGRPHDPVAYEAFLRQIGYLVPEGPDFTIETSGVDPEIALIPGPQLVVPVMNARFALNACNARWASLYDALYGTDAVGSVPAMKGYDPERGARVVAWGRAHLDAVAPLQGARWADLTGLVVRDGALVASIGPTETTLHDRAQFVGYLHDSMAEWHILLLINGLLIEVVVDRRTTIGSTDPAGISDIWVEAAVSAIMDCEDSIAAVDAADKVVAYANWLGLMRGDLVETFDKAGKTITRAMRPDFDYLTPEGTPLLVKGRALMLVRNVGHLMTNPAILDRQGHEVPEGIMDAMITTLCAMHDLAKRQGPRNSETGAVYVVKPKMHGPDEVAFADRIFTRVEAALGLPQNTVKLGIMDEERRTSANLRECIRAAKSRVCFINTGFLDRTGDEIHTSMEAGPMVPKGAMKDQPWIKSYEDRNVDIGLACGFQGRAQIGKGMWAMPDLMAEMLRLKVAHPTAGANCAWVPSPTAAALHATHYHKVDVRARQAAIKAGGPRGTLTDLLTFPVAMGVNWSQDEVTAELENNAQGILGYVVRWVDQGIGCSKVPDIHDVALMEDRATCRISAQAMANWLHHGVASEEQVLEALHKMAVRVDAQNADDPAYVPMAPGYDGAAFAAACDLVLAGRIQPSGYTEPILHLRRLEVKAG